MRLYDVIYSNAALHWLGDHEPLVPRLFSFVRTGGVLRSRRHAISTECVRCSCVKPWPIRVGRRNCTACGTGGTGLHPKAITTCSYATRQRRSLGDPLFPRSGRRGCCVPLDDGNQPAPLRRGARQSSEGGVPGALSRDARCRLSQTARSQDNPSILAFFLVAMAR